MSSLTMAFVSLPAAPILEAVLFAGLLFHFYRRHQRKYLLLWALCWAAFSAFQLCSVTAGWFSESAFSFGATAATLLAAAGFALFQIAWLLWGCYELAMRRPLPIRLAKRLSGWAGLGSLLLWGFLLLIARQPTVLYVTLVALHSLLAGAAFVASAYGTWRFRGKSEGTGFLFLPFGLAGYGAVQLSYIVPGVLWLFSRGPLPYPGSLGSYLFALQGAAGFGMFICFLDDERRAALLAASQVEHLAYHDTLTGLPNRDLFQDRLRMALAQANRHQYKVAILFLDLDRFKEINDSLGHSAGDSLLRMAAERIRACVREGDTVARFGGDEFAILIHIIGRFEDAGRVAQKIIDTLHEPFLVAGHDLVVTSSIGITIYPLDGEDAETLVRNADTAMYRAKQGGRDGYQLYTPAMNSRALERLDMENRLRRAVQNNELILHYQPLYDAGRNTIFGLEALLRWNHPELGMLLPERFIPAAESSGLIIPIGNWVLREACRQAKEWQKEGMELVVAVNLSPRQFLQPDLVRQILLAIHQAQINPRLLELEITESVAMHDFEATMRTLRELRRVGVRISIDDFGTGYSSLMYLKSFPVDTLKLDQSFVRDLSAPPDAAIAKGIISIAHNLDLTVIAEGVETEVQYNFLREHHCDRIQGHYLSLPLPPDRFAQFAAKNRALFNRPEAFEAALTEASSSGKGSSQSFYR